MADLLQKQPWINAERAAKKMLAKHDVARGFERRQLFFLHPATPSPDPPFAAPPCPAPPLPQSFDSVTKRGRKSALDRTRFDRGGPRVFSTRENPFRAR